ncbi:putative WRKY transcription factor [Quillaja saponaria]|uniref:WRKY transcription factor n=1 Tax=Quillaja saponaria TaxID=32244 RepID=A0AAD7PK26_QUISA|nr:putative WRKY transcription factor [Quillaja saponaria]
MESTWVVDTSLDLNLNSSSHIKKDDIPATEVLVEDLQRMRSENKKLSEMLTQICQSYIALKTQFSDLMNNKKDSDQESRKRKAMGDDQISNMSGIINGNTECSSNYEESCKRPKENMNKERVSRDFCTN